MTDFLTEEGIETFDDLVGLLRKDLLPNLVTDIEPGSFDAALALAMKNFARPARKFRGAAFSLPVSIWTEIPVDTYPNSQAIDDPFKSFNASGRYVAQQAGLYAATGQVELAVGTGTTGVILGNGAIWKNGVVGGSGEGTRDENTITNQTGVAEGFSFPIPLAVFFLNVGDYISLWGFSSQGGGTALAVQSGDWTNSIHVWRIA